MKPHEILPQSEQVDEASPQGFGTRIGQKLKSLSPSSQHRMSAQAKLQRGDYANDLMARWKHYIAATDTESTAENLLYFLKNSGLSQAGLDAAKTNLSGQNTSLPTTSDGASASAPGSSAFGQMTSQLGPQTAGSTGGTITQTPTGQVHTANPSNPNQQLAATTPAPGGVSAPAPAVSNVDYDAMADEWEAALRDEEARVARETEEARREAASGRREPTFESSSDYMRKLLNILNEAEVKLSDKVIANAIMAAATAQTRLGYFGTQPQSSTQQSAQQTDADYNITQQANAQGQQATDSAASNPEEHYTTQILNQISRMGISYLDDMPTIARALLHRMSMLDRTAYNKFVDDIYRAKSGSTKNVYVPPQNREEPTAESKINTRRAS